MVAVLLSGTLEVAEVSGRSALPVRKAARVQAVTCLAQLALPHQIGKNPRRGVCAVWVPFLPLPSVSLT
jgi:hypothetical protein